MQPIEFHICKLVFIFPVFGARRTNKLVLIWCSLPRTLRKRKGNSNTRSRERFQGMHVSHFCLCDPHFGVILHWNNSGLCGM